MKNIVLGAFLLFFSWGKSQLGNDKGWKIVAVILSTRIEGTSLGDKTFLSVGMKLPSEDTRNYYSLRGHFNWWDERKLLIIPEFDYFRKIKAFGDEDLITSLYAGAGVSPYAASPKFGVTFCHFFTGEAGYNFEYNTYKHFPVKGFRYSFGFNIVF